ncbi:hypothetical protein [Hyalangium sp.]|uniref:hypothetical protein n=1 Tax=Hyalangium sp. TaxID=2028555 RepID=UPI002D539C89|nr:hypothetical protein [Hyalangium sp.]HYI00457.1 hypothetical protein [Hyalangium sp.]
MKQRNRKRFDPAFKARVDVPASSLPGCLPRGPRRRARFQLAWMLATSSSPSTRHEPRVEPLTSPALTTRPTSDVTGLDTGHEPGAHHEARVRRDRLEPQR